MARVSCCLAVLGTLIFTSATPLLAEMVVDGSTRTRVVVNANGSVSVGIAEASRDGVSVNRFERFSVGKAGASFDNRTEGARTIVTEVTGNSRTRIEGRVAVDGQRAHLIFANPNGITVDGGRFVNTGQVVLGAGRITGVDREIAPGVFQRNMRLTTSAHGSVIIEGGGVAGQMDALHLIAGQVRIDGIARNSDDRDLGGVRIVAGQSLTEFDSATVPGNIGQPWATTTSRGHRNTGLVYQLGAAGGVHGGRIEVLVTDQGAGVRMAGRSLANRGAFVLTSSGEVALRGGQVRSQTGTLIQSGSITGRDARIGAVQGDTALVTAQKTAGIRLTDSHVAGEALRLDSAAGIHLSGDDSRLTARKGNLVLIAGRAITDQGGNWQAAGWITGDAKTGLSFKGSSVVSGQEAGLIFATDGQFLNQDSKLDGDVLVSVTAAAARFETHRVQAETIARRGSLKVTTKQGDVVNRGTLLQGGQAIAGENGTAGAVVIRSAGSYRASSTSAEHQAIVFGLAGDVRINARGGGIHNHNARILANGDIRLLAMGRVVNSIDMPNGSNTPGIIDASKKDSLWWSAGLLSGSRRVLAFDYGTMADADLDALILASGGNVRIKGASYESAGGQALAHVTEDGVSGGNIRIDAKDLSVTGVATGSVRVERHCNPFCRYKTSGPGVTLTGGVVQAGGELQIRLSGDLRNSGGLLTAEGDVDIDAASAHFTGLPIPFVVKRPGGLYNLWASDAGWIVMRDLFGGVISQSGSIGIRTPGKVVLDRAELAAKGRIVTPGGQDLVARPGTTVLMRDGQIGWPADIAPVAWE